jgi:hypothetical protein
MATIPKTGISTGQAITAAQILNIIQALDGTDATDIVLDGIVTLNGITQANTGTNVLTIDGSGRVYKTGSYGGGGSGGGVASFTNSNGTFISAGTANSSATGAVTMGTIDLSASGTKNINTVLRGDNTFGTPTTASYALTASMALNAGDPFPYTGDPTITGKLILRDNASDENMYIGPGPVPVFGSFADRNIVLGHDAGGTLNQTDNIAIGTDAMQLNDYTKNSIAIGLNSMQNGTGTLQNNVGVGVNTLQNLKDNSITFFNPYYNTAVGYGTIQNIENSAYNTAIGVSALQGGTQSGGTPATQKVENVVAVGRQAGQNIASGSGCVFIGAFAGRYMGGSSNTVYHVKDNVFIGDECADVKENGNGNTYIGSQIIGGGASATAGVYNETIIGNATSGTGTNTVNLGNTSITHIRGQVSPSTYSDRRIKRNIESGSLGLNFINILNAVRFQKVNPADYPPELIEAKYTTRTKFKNIPDYPYSSSYIVPPISPEPTDNRWYDGLIAQEVSASLSTLGIESDIWSETETNQKQEIKYSALTIPLIKAVQELSARVEALEAQINGGM